MSGVARLVTRIVETPVKFMTVTRPMLEISKALEAVSLANDGATRVHELGAKALSIVTGPLGKKPSTPEERELQIKVFNLAMSLVKAASPRAGFARAPESESADSIALIEIKLREKYKGILLEESFHRVLNEAIRVMGFKKPPIGENDFISADELRSYCLSLLEREGARAAELLGETIRQAAIQIMRKTGTPYHRFGWIPEYVRMGPATLVFVADYLLEISEPPAGFVQR